MIPSPLALQTHFFTKVAVEACPEACDAADDGDLSTSVEFQQHEEDSQKWLVNLGVCREKSSEEEGCPEYTFNVQIFGVFGVDEDYPAEKADKLVRANAPAMLYGAVREMLLNVTGRGPFGPCTLPTVSFIDEAERTSDSEPARGNEE
jgi:preprotein translocase subunit SecB